MTPIFLMPGDCADSKPLSACTAKCMTSHIEEPPLRDRLTLTVPEAGALSGIPARVVRAAVLNGDMPACYAGSTTMRIRRTDLDEWVANLPVDPPTPK